MVGTLWSPDAHISGISSMHAAIPIFIINTYDFNKYLGIHLAALSSGTDFVDILSACWTISRKKYLPVSYVGVQLL